MGREHRRHVPITCVGFSFKIWEVRVGVLANLIMWYILFASFNNRKEFWLSSLFYLCSAGNESQRESTTVC